MMWKIIVFQKNFKPDFSIVIVQRHFHLKIALCKSKKET